MEAIKQLILRDGFAVIEDPNVGRRFNEFAGRRYPFPTMQGLEFLDDTLNDNRITGLIESLFELSGLGMFHVFGPHIDTARAPLNKTTEELLVVNVLHCQPGFRITLYDGSHKIALNAKPPAKKQDDVGLLELSTEAVLAQSGITPISKTLPDGGYILLDGRLFCTIVEGIAIWVGFGVEKEVRQWYPILYPNSPPLQEKVQRMQRKKIRANIAFI